MKPTVSPFKHRQNPQYDKQQLKQTLQQIKLLKIKTNQRIQQYEKTTEQQKKQIELLKDRLAGELIIKENLLIEIQSINDVKQNLEIITNSQSQIQKHLEEKTLLVEYLRKQTEEFQKKYYQVKEELEEKIGEIEWMRKEKVEYEARVDRINCLLGTRTISDLEQFSFLENSNLVAYIEAEKESKMKIEMDMTFLNNQLMETQQMMDELKEESTQLKQLLDLANQKNEVLCQSEKNLRSTETQLRLELTLKSQEMSRLNDETFLLKSQMLSFGEEIERQKEMIKEFTFKQEEDEKEMELHREYNILIDQVMNEKEEFSVVNSEIELLELFKMEHQSNINKVKFLCEQLDSC